MKSNPSLTSTTMLGIVLRVLSLTAVLISCSKNSSADGAKDEPAQATPFHGGVYRSIDDTNVVTIISQDELEMKEGGTNLICKYTKKDDTFRVVATVLGTQQALYFKITEYGLQGSDRKELFAPSFFEAAQCRNKGYEASLKGDYARSIADYSEAVRLNPKWGISYLNRGLAYISVKNYDQALMDLAEAVRLDPQNAVAYEARGTTYEHLGDHNKALSDFTEALRLDPKNVLACNGLAWVLATRPTSVASDGVTAVGYALKACELLNWEVPGCLPTLAAAYAQSGDFTKAIQWEKKYLETQNLDPKAATRARQRLALYEAHKPYHVEK